MPQAGYGPVKRMLFDSVVTLPMGITSLRNISGGRDTAQIRYNKNDSSIYVYTGSQWVKSSGGSTIDTTSLSNRINLKVNISDTANKWISAVSKPNDSSLSFTKGTTVTTYSISTVTSAKRLATLVYNSTGTTIAKGSVVYINGRHSSNLPTIALAQANDEANSYKTFAITAEDIPTSSSGLSIQAGNITGLNLPTSTYTDGDIVYLSPTVAGGITITKPLASNHICKLGSVTRAHPTQGTIEIKIENGWQLDELSDVQIPAVPNDSTVLQFSRVDSLWHAVSPTSVIDGYAWKTSGNSDVNAGRFIGSTNNASVRLRTNNTERVVIDSIGSVGIGTSLAAASSLVDITSTGKGLLIPRMTTNQRNAITSPASQLLVSNTDKQTIDQYNGTAWSSIAGDYNKDLLAIQLLGSPIKSTGIGAPFLPNTGTGMSDGRSYYNAVYVDKKITSTGVAFYQATQGAFTADNFNGLALYSYSAGTATQIAITANDGNIWKNTSGTWVQVAWTASVTIEPGVYYIGALYNTSVQTTAPVIGVFNPVAIGNYFAPLTTNSSKIFGGIVNLVNTFPSSQALSNWTNISTYYALYLY